jgi:hypothetical protein
MLLLLELLLHVPATAASLQVCAYSIALATAAAAAAAAAGGAVQSWLHSLVGSIWASSGQRTCTQQAATNQ